MCIRDRADIENIVSVVKRELKWSFPLSNCNWTGVLPKGDHPGSFLAKRKHSIHTGIDLYCPEYSVVHAVEAGKVVGIEPFTGPKDNSPWWRDTDCILIEGKSGVVCYGEVRPYHHLTVGMNVRRREPIADVIRVLLDGKERPDIPGHSTSMLHMELYPFGHYKASNTYEKDKDILNDPTPFLEECKPEKPL